MQRIGLWPGGMRSCRWGVRTPVPHWPSLKAALGGVSKKTNASTTHGTQDFGATTYWRRDRPLRHMRKLNNNSYFVQDHVHPVAPSPAAAAFVQAAAAHKKSGGSTTRSCRTREFLRGRPRIRYQFGYS
jgi:hypothetical protein